MTDCLRLDDQLCFSLYAASRAATNAYRKGLAELGLTYPQFIVLIALWEEDGLGVSALGERLYLDSGTLSPLLKRLEGMDVIERRKGQGDERRVGIFLTQKGRDLAGPARKVHGEISQDFCMKPDEARILADLARRFLANASGPHPAV